MSVRPTLAGARAAVRWPFAWDGPWFAAMRDVCEVVAAEATWPTVTRLDELLARWLAPHGLRLHVQPPARQGARETMRSLYEVQIGAHRQIPTREGNLHDLLNALTWAAYPQAKWAVAGKLAALQAARLGPDGQLPGRRSTEHDRLALFEEGGVVARASSALDLAPDSAAIYGHALLEHAALGLPMPRASLVVLPANSERLDLEAWRDSLDQALAQAFSDGDPLRQGPGVNVELAWLRVA